jgi:N-acetylglucosaminyldiphosphoundecaprenol N-acetyl-beta-D-mannosaminyltransferase
MNPTTTDPSTTIENSRLPRANILGIGVHAIEMEDAVAAIESTIRDGRKQYVCVTDVNSIMEAQRHPEFASILRAALLVTPDGMPTVWIGRLQGFSRMRRVFGPDLMLELCRRSVDQGFTHYLYGGTEGVAERLKARLQADFPGIRIVGSYCPPFRPLEPREQRELVHQFDRLKPDITWVGLGCPKQERFMSEYLPKLDTAVMIGVGAAFDFHTGKISDSPQWVKYAGLQWFHRLLQDPKRLWRRYLINNPDFLWRVALQLSGLKHYSVFK